MKNKKIVINSIIIGIVLGIMMWGCVEEYTEIKIQSKEKGKSNIRNIDLAEKKDNNLDRQQESNVEYDNNTGSNENRIEREINTENQQENNGGGQTDNILEDGKKIREYPKAEVVSEYRGYNVIAKLEIPKIKLETYVLQNHSINSLKVSVTKFWGAGANEVGNFCIAGHNFVNKNMFHNLKDLEIGDSIFVSDNNIRKNRI